MACDPQVLKNVPLFALLDDEETAVLASQVEHRTFAPRERIYKIGDSSGPAYVVLSGKVHVSTVDEDQQEVVIAEPEKGEFFGFASMLEQTPTRPPQLHSKKPPAWKFPGMTLPFYCNANRWRGWTCSPR